MALLLLTFGAAFALIFLILSGFRTFRRQRVITRIEIVLAFFVTLLPVAALMFDNLQDAGFGLIERASLLLVGPLALGSIIMLIIELLRRVPLRQSRGLLGIGIAALLTMATFGFHVIALALQTTPAASVVQRPTPVNVVALTGDDPCEPNTIGAQLSTSFLLASAEATGLSVDELLATVAGNGALSMAELVQRNDGDPQALIDTVTQAFDATLLNLVANDCITMTARLQAINLLEASVARTIEEDFDTVIMALSTGEFAPGGRGGGPEGEPLLTAAEMRTTRVALISTIPTIDPRPSLTPTPTLTITPSATATSSRTPFPTATPLPTRERFVTATPSATPTLPNPCQAQASFNVNMRTLPDLENGEIVLTIPFEEVFEVYGPNPAQTWWYGEYEGESGWVSGEFITVSPACRNLPAIEP